MNIKPNPKFLLIILSLIIYPFFVNAQVGRANLIGAYTYNFARYTTWPNEATQDSFKILLISDNEKVIGEFRAFSKTRKIKDKPIGLDVYSSVPHESGNNIRMIILTNEKSDRFYEIYKRIGDRPILLISENFSDKRNVMINLYDTPKHELVFEVNKANIINRNLIIDPEILLLGGTEIDVAGLYRTSQKSLEVLEIRMKLMNDSLSSLNNKISQTLRQIEDQQANISKQKKLFEEQGRELETGRIEINSRRTDIEKFKDIFHQQKDQLENQKTSLEEQLIDLSEQKAYTDLQQKEIRKSKAILDSLTGEINDKNLVLGQQSDIIKRQKLTVILAVIIGLLSLVVLISIINGYRNKVRKNKLLTQQKEEIEKINKKLEATNKSLYSTITKLSETQSQLVSSEKMASLGVLTAGIAHEINNPVNFIYTGINSLRKDYDELIFLIDEIDKTVIEKGSDELVVSVEKIRKNGDFSEIIEIIPQTIDDIKIGAERAADIIKGLRNFSRVDKDSMQLSDIHEGIDSALLLLKNKFKNHITVEKDYKQLPKIECYPGKLNQAFLNLIGNSIDAIEKEGKITIRTWPEGDQVFIQIEDTGKGIPPAIIDKIFDPFFTTKSVGKGVGLGLSITFGIIKDHNGKIDVKSEINSGTIFTISLPCIING
jgi:signal transduction histidine kinase